MTNATNMLTTTRIFAPMSHLLVPRLCRIEVSSTFKVPHFIIVGLPGPEVNESRERIRAAFASSDMTFPRRRVAVNLLPSAIKKLGTGTDLGIALAIGSLGRSLPDPFAAHGELGMDGRVHSTGKIARCLYAAKVTRLKFMIIPKADEIQAASALKDLDCSVKIFPVETLREAWSIVCGGLSPKPLEAKSTPVPRTVSTKLLPIAPLLHRVVSLSAAGAHHLLLLGPKGVGKSYACHWRLALHPPLDPRTRAENRLLYELSEDRLQAPFRFINAQVRPSSLLGSSRNGKLRCGEFSLANGGVLIADELPEWHRDSRESLRGPLESRQVFLQTASLKARLPANFVLMGTGNFCSCGTWPNHSQASRICRCTEHEREKYQKRLSHALLDRVDIILRLTGNPPNGRLQSPCRSSTLAVGQHLFKRWGCLPGEMNANQIEPILQSHRALCREIDALPLSPRQRHRVARLALTISGWDGSSLSDAVKEASVYC